MSQIKRARNEKNQFLCDHFEKELRKFHVHNNPNMKFSIQKILKSLTKYPLPIICSIDLY